MYQYFMKSDDHCAVKEKTLFTWLFHVRISPKRICLRRKQKKKQIKRHKYMLNEKQFQIQIEKKNT